jgi:YARHG domain
MKRIIRLISVFLISIVLFTACATKEKDESSQASKDSGLANNPTTRSESQPIQTPEDLTVFEKFIELFDSPGAQIPPDMLSALSVSNEGGKYTSEEILRNDSIVFVLFNHFRPVGPGVDQLHAAVFSKEGTLLGQQLMGSSYPSSGPDGGGEDYNYQYDAERKILYVTNSTIEWDEGVQQDVTKKESHSFQLTKDGKLIAPSREYPEVSERLLEKGELSNKTKEELMIMRNEPFAAYGYIFKNTFLKSYFDSKTWYVPQFDNVSEKLNEIEKVNVRLIKEVEDTKK